jgi:molecular chaperone DnaK (HSP70)
MQTPSFVSYPADKQPLVGESAFDKEPIDDKNTIFGMKRILGRSFDDPEV